MPLAALHVSTALHPVYFEHITCGFTCLVATGAAEL